jgi:imidazolonepropionase
MRGVKGPRRGPELQDLGIISDGSLLIRDGLIEEVGPTRRVENLAAARGAVEVNASGRVVMPGFVDCHTHLVFPPELHGSCDDDAALRAVRTGTAQRLQTRARTYLEAMARHGTTTVEAKTGCELDARCETKLFRVLASLKSQPLEVVPSFFFCLPPPDVTNPDTTQAAVDRILLELLPKIRRRKFAQFADLSWEPNPNRQKLFERYLEAATALGFRCKVHADHGTPAGAISLAIRHSAASVDHLEHATAADVVRLGGSQTVAALLPYASFRGGRYAPGRALIDAGAAVALGTNFNPNHTPALNMQTVVSLACMRMDLTPAEALSAATINGAHALDYADRVGSLELGKSADLVILNVSDYADVVHHFGMNVVHATMKRGKVIYREADVGGRSEAAEREYERTIH